jgi:hypothetical protein
MYDEVHEVAFGKFRTTVLESMLQALVQLKGEGASQTAGIQQASFCSQRFAIRSRPKNCIVDQQKCSTHRWLPRN